MGNRSYARCGAPDMESCRSEFLAKLYSVMTRRLSGALWQVARASDNWLGLRTLDSRSLKKSMKQFCI
jgi:hypothetical protein